MTRPHLRGFTLVELLVVFAIMAVMIAVVPAALGKLQQSVAYRQTVQDMTTYLRVARQQSMTEGRYTAVLLNVQEGSYALEGQSPVALDSSLRLEVETAAIADDANGVQSIIFLPQGGSTGGSISILRASTATGVRLRVDWLSGMVTQEAL